MANWRDKYDEDIIRRVENRDYAGGGADAVRMTDEDYAAVLNNQRLWGLADEAGRAALHDDTERIRSGYAYSGGVDGSQYIPTGGGGSTMKDTVQLIQNQLYNYGKFTNPYQAGYDAKYKAIMDRQPFSYDLESDPQWAAYRNQYTRLGQRAYDDALARMSARTGGLASSYAGGVAQQQYGNYMQQMTDKIPELYRLAYDMYSQDAARDIADLNAIRGMAGDEYNWWQGDYNRLGTALSVAQQAREYADKQTDKAREDQLAYAKLLANMGDYSALDAYYGGGTALADAYAAQQAAKGSGGGSKRTQANDNAENDDLIKFTDPLGYAMTQSAKGNPGAAYEYLVGDWNNLSDSMRISLMQYAGIDPDTAVGLNGRGAEYFQRYVGTSGVMDKDMTLPQITQNTDATEQGPIITGNPQLDMDIMEMQSAGPGEIDQTSVASLGLGRLSPEELADLVSDPNSGVTYYIGSDGRIIFQRIK